MASIGGFGKPKGIIQCLCIAPVLVVMGILFVSYSSNDLRERFSLLGSVAPGNGSVRESIFGVLELVSGLEEVYRQQQDLLDRLVKQQAETETALRASQQARGTLASRLTSLQGAKEGKGLLGEAALSSDESEGQMGSSEGKALVAECFTLRGECVALEKRTMDVAQREQQQWRDMKIKYHAFESIEFLEKPETSAILSNLNITPPEAKAYYEANQPNDELFQFVGSYLLYGHLWKPGDKEHTQSLRTDAEQGDLAYQSLQQEHQSLRGEMDKCLGRLREKCGLQLAGYDWLDEAAIAELDKKRGPDADRSAIGLIAPPDIAKLNMRAYPDSSVNVSFIVQYYNQPESLMAMVDRLYACTEGSLGKGQVPGITTELVVNVDEPSAVSLWMEAWKKTDKGDFLVPIFQHNIHENRGYNRAAGASRGEVLVMLQDDDLPPEDCGWLTDVLTAFNSWPRLGVVGGKAAWFTIGAYEVIDRSSPAYFNRVADNDETMLFQDPQTGVSMQFVSVVDLAPMIFRRSAFFELGGFNEGNGMKGEAGIFSDWEICMRAWLDGWQVGQVAIAPGRMFRGSNLGQGGGTHVGTQAFIRSRNEGFNGIGLNLMTGVNHHNRIFIEVKRMNSMLQLRPGRQKLWD